VGWQAHSVTIFGPSLDWREYAFGHTDHPLNFAVDLLWLGVPPDGEDPTVGSRQAQGYHLVGGELAAQCLPGIVNALFEERALNTDQHVIGPHTQKNCGFQPAAPDDKR